MTVQVYMSTDGSAPTLSGTAGDLVNLLDKCLVAGYGAKAAAGWTKPFTGTNKAVFRNSAITGTGFYLNVQDNAPGVGGAKEARIWGYEVCTAQDTGTNQFPTTAQFVNGVFVRKSTTADATTRPWVLLADETVFYLFIESGDFTGLDHGVFGTMFGDFYSYKTSDAYRCAIIGRGVENSGLVSNGVEFFNIINAIGSSNSGGVLNQTASIYIARGTAGSGTAVVAGKHTDSAKLDGVALGYATNVTGTLNNPNPADNGLYMAPIYLHHNNGVRGYLKGLWAPLAVQPLSHGDTFTGSGSLSAKSFLMQSTMSGVVAVSGRCILETSNTWS